MRILVFNWKDVTHPRAGGAEVFTHEVATRWVRQGHEVTVFCAATPGPSAEVIDGVSYMRVGTRLGVYRQARRFYRERGRGRFDLVVDEVNTRPFGCARWIRDTPVIALIHQPCREIWFYEAPFPVAVLGRFLLEPLWLRAYRDLRVLTVSESSRAGLARLGLRDIRLIPTGTSCGPRPEVERESRPTLIFLGRMTASKRPAHVLEAFRILRRRRPDAQLWMVGDGPVRPRLQGRETTGVRFFGCVGDACRDELLARAHVLVLASVREGWGMVVDEAAKMGTPTVAYRSPGLRDSVAAAGGLLVDPSPGALARGVDEFLERRRHGWELDRPAGERSWDVTAESILREAATDP